MYIVWGLEPWFWNRLIQRCGSSRIFFASASSFFEVLPLPHPFPIFYEKFSRFWLLKKSNASKFASASSKCFRFHKNLAASTSLVRTKYFDIFCLNLELRLTKKETQKLIDFEFSIRWPSWLPTTFILALEFQYLIFYSNAVSSIFLN